LCPKHIETSIYPYPPEARAARIQGKVTLRITIDAEGNVKNAEVADDPTHQARRVLQESAIDNIRRWTFEKPAIAPATQVIVYEYKFDDSLRAPYPSQVLKVIVDLPDHVTVVSSNPYWQPDQLKNKKPS
jgi:TonB family protein